MRKNMEAVRRAMETQKSSDDGGKKLELKRSRILGLNMEGPFLNLQDAGP